MENVTAEPSSRGYLNKIEKGLGLLALMMVLYHLAVTFFPLLPSSQHYLIHYALVMTFALLIRMLSPRRTKRGVLLCILAMLFLIIPTIYLIANEFALAGRIGFLNETDFIMGSLLVTSTLVVVWMLWGPILPLLCLASMAYFFFGDLIPPPLGHAPLTPGFVMSYLCMGTNTGIYGFLLPISANFMFLLLTLSGLLAATNVLPAFLELGKFLGNLARTGPAYGAVVASSLMGMLSGSAIANVTFTGTFTIPSMKSCGYSAADAGGIEATASCGGQVTPPIMATAAFIMAGFIGIPYVVIVMKAVIPALVYYIAVAFAIYLLARTKHIAPPKEPVNWHIVSRQLPPFVIVIALIFVLLLQHYSLGFVAGTAVLTLIVLSLLQKETRPSLNSFLQGLKYGVGTAASIGVLLGLVGIISQGIITPGLGSKLGIFITSLTQGQLLIALPLCMILCLILGIGMPSTPAYILAALTVVPTIVALGVPLIPAHFFALYFAIFSTLTPPVALASLAASRLAGANWMKTSLSALRIAFVAWILPFIFVMHPSLLGFPHMTTEGIIVTLLTVVAAGLLGVTIYGFLPGYGFLGRYKRILVLVSFLAIAFYLIGGASPVLIGVSAGILAGLIIWKKFGKRAEIEK